MSKSPDQISAEPLTSTKVILFDVYETLLDMSEVKTKINRLLDSKRGYTIWFDMLLQYSWLDNSTGQYHDFAVLASLAMDTAAKVLGRSIATENKDDVLQMMRQLPVHEDVQKSLSLLRDSECRLAALTNVSEAAILERMQRTGIISYFDAVLSAESVRKHKPAKEVYQWAAQTLRVPVNEVLMITAHGWDIAGALYAGMQTAFIERKGQVLYPLAPLPLYKVKNLTALVKQLLPTAKNT